MSNCIIIFSKHYGFCYQEALAELIVNDEGTLNAILDLGFVRNDLQSLFVHEKYRIFNFIFDLFYRTRS